MSRPKYDVSWTRQIVGARHVATTLPNGNILTRSVSVLADGREVAEHTHEHLPENWALVVGRSRPAEGRFAWSEVTLDGVRV